jgi:hypothetical protein
MSLGFSSCARGIGVALGTPMDICALETLSSGVPGLVPRQQRFLSTSGGCGFSEDFPRLCLAPHSPAGSSPLPKASWSSTPAADGALAVRRSSTGLAVTIGMPKVLRTPAPAAQAEGGSWVPPC